MGMDKATFVVERCGGATGSHVTVSDVTVSDVTGSDVSGSMLCAFATGSVAISALVGSFDRKCSVFSRVFFLVVVQNVVQ
jgi:hypothetical protein